MENIVLAIVALESLRDFNFMTNHHNIKITAQIIING